MSEEAKPGGRLVALAAAAHPDDIEFLMAGTLLLLKEAGADIHMWNLANGSCGTTVEEPEEITRTRWQETQDSARVAGATAHPAIVNDLDIFYERSLLEQAASLVRTVKPDILLVPSLQDYMEDHQNAGRLMVTAAFARGMRNYPTSPAVEPWMGDVALYHAMPYGLRDGMGRLVRPGLFVDVGSVHGRKREMLAQHRSQKEWLDATQGLDAYLAEMERLSREVGAMSGRYEFAEGWRQHSHIGFGPEGYDPLSELLRDACWEDPEYRKILG